MSRTPRPAFTADIQGEPVVTKYVYGAERSATRPSAPRIFPRVRVFIGQAQRCASTVRWVSSREKRITERKKTSALRSSTPRESVESCELKDRWLAMLRQ